jgi:hypothetical protein
VRHDEPVNSAELPMRRADRDGAASALHKTVAALAKKTYRDEIMAFAGVTAAA